MGIEFRFAVGVGEEPQHLQLHEHVDALGHRLLLEGPDELQAGPVADVGQAGVPVPTEVPLEDQAGLGPVEQGPQSSSSRTRSGDSCAWSWAMRQLLSILPPRMVSRKWTFQLSSE